VPEIPISVNVAIPEIAVAVRVPISVPPALMVAVTTVDESLTNTDEF
jgi:hypothetical protein